MANLIHYLGTGHVFPIAAANEREEITKQQFIYQQDTHTRSIHQPSFQETLMHILVSHQNSEKNKTK